MGRDLLRVLSSRLSCILLSVSRMGRRRRRRRSRDVRGRKMDERMGGGLVGLRWNRLECSVLHIRAALRHNERSRASEAHSEDGWNDIDIIYSLFHTPLNHHTLSNPPWSPISSS